MIYCIDEFGLEWFDDQIKLKSEDERRMIMCDLIESRISPHLITDFLEDYHFSDALFYQNTINIILNETDLKEKDLICYYRGKAFIAEVDAKNLDGLEDILVDNLVFGAVILDEKMYIHYDTITKIVDLLDGELKTNFEQIITNL